MKIISFSAENYRSITSTTKLHLHDLNVLIGPNNEGKSNLLRAFELALSYLTEKRPIVRRRVGRLGRYRGYYRNAINYDIDYPNDLKNIKGLKSSKFIIEISFSRDEYVKIDKNTKRPPLCVTIEISIAYDEDDNTPKKTIRILS